MYTMILPEGNAANFVEQIFRVFDKDGDGTIDFKVLGLTCLLMDNCLF